MQVDEILKQRGGVYGDYNTGLNHRVNIFKIVLDIYLNKNGSTMPENIQMGFLDIINKLVRAASSPHHTDSLIDLAGYATLLSRTIEGEGVLYVK